jgi:phosphinothricin acetyltransferase
LLVRRAQPADAASIARIYNQALEERIATFETEPRTPEQIVAQMEAKADHYPTVVVERQGQVIAWAGISAYRARECYAGVGEHSVYADHSARRTGAGTAALGGLIREAEARGFWKLVSRIFAENAPSRALHLKLGFREVGVYSRHARLDGRWIDCVIVEKLLGDAAVAPEHNRPDQNDAPAIFPRAGR